MSPVDTVLNIFIFETLCKKKNPPFGHYFKAMIAAGHIVSDMVTFIYLKADSESLILALLLKFVPSVSQISSSVK